jgi:hypothetical protein
MVFCTLWGTQMGTLRYLMWIWRETYGGEFVGLVVLNPPSIKLRVTCVYVLLVLTIGPSFQFGSLKTMILMNGH